MSLIKLMHNVFGLIEVYFKPYLFTIDIAIMYATKITIPQISFYKIFFLKDVKLKFILTH